MSEGGRVIEARKLRLWDGRYDLLEDGRWVATWERSLWATGGRFELGGRSFTVRANLLGDEASLTEAGGRPDLPGLPREVEVFAIAVVLTRWESDSAATG